MVNLPEPRIVLASESARRIEILHTLGLEFRHEASGISEGCPRKGEPQRDYALRLATAKADAVAARFPSSIVIGADTVVAVGTTLLGKPADELDARSMLRKLSGNWHEVITGLCLVNGQTDRRLTAAASTRVRFLELDEQEISRYVATLEPMGKAGAYAIQGRAAIFVREIQGCYFNIVGFPVSLFYRLWKTLKLPVHTFLSST